MGNFHDYSKFEFEYKIFSLTSTPVDIVFIADKNHAFDFFIFSQQWPVTRCILMAETNKGHMCASSFDEQRWTIHGIWPTRIGTKSPAFCHKSKSFDIHNVEPFINELSKNWLNVANGELNFKKVAS